MRKPIHLPHEIVDQHCNPTGQNFPCTFLRFINDECYCARSTSIEDSLNIIRDEAGLPRLHGNCCGYPLFIPNIIVGPDLYPNIMYKINTGSKIILVKIPYTIWEKFRELAIEAHTDVHSFITQLTLDTISRNSEE